MFKYKLIFFLSFIFNAHFFSQIISTNFIAPDTVCANETFTIQNTSTGSINTTYWSFCASATSTISQAVNLGFNSAFGNPCWLSINNDAGNYYIFVSNNSPGSLARLSFGNNLNNIPVSTNLGTFGNSIPINCEGIFIEKEGSVWYGVFVGGPNGSDRICKLNFGTSLANTPTVVNMGNIGGMNYPHRIQVIHSGGNKYGFTINRSNNTLTRFDFGTSLSNTPTGTNLGNIGSMNGPSDIAFINYAGNWHAFVTNDNNSTITRLDFGNSLLNTPTGINIGNPGGLSNPRAIYIDVDCDGIKGQLTNRSPSSILKLTFPTGPTGPIITTNLGNVASFSFPHSIEKYRVGDTVFSFIPNAWSSSISRLKYASCINSSVPSSTMQNLSLISFSVPGVYQVGLYNNEVQYNKSVYCKNIVVGPSNISVTSSPTTICSGASTSATLLATGALSYTWDPGAIVSNSIIITPTASTIYTVSGTSTSTFGCVGTTTIGVSVIPSPTLSTAFSNTSVCAGTSLTLSVSGANNYSWAPVSSTGNSIIITPSVTTIYTVTGTNGVCIDTKTIQVDVNPNPTVTAFSSSSVICSGASTSATLIASGASSYTWDPGAIVSNSIIITPTASTIYTVNGASASTLVCISTKTISASVISTPTLSTAFSNTSVCAGTSLTLSVSGANNYSWAPTSSTESSIIITPSVSTIYTITGTNGVCVDTKTIQVDVNPNPTVTAFSSPSVICTGNSATLTGSGATSYTWIPNVSLTNTLGAVTVSNPSVTTSYTVLGASGTCTDYAVTSLSVLALPVVAVTVSSPTICSGNSVSLTAFGASSYTWDPISINGNSIITSPSVSINYTLTGSNGNCSNSVVISVSVNPNPTVNVTAFSNVVCYGGSETLFAGGADSYSWSPSTYLSSTTGQTVLTTPASPICYSVVGYNSFGCVSISETVCMSIVNTTQTFTSIATPSILCSGSIGTISSTGASSYTYYTSPNAYTPSINVNPTVSTVYTVQARFLDECLTTNTVLLNVQQVPTVNIIASPSVICNGEQTLLEGIGALNYTWNPGNISSTNIAVSPTTSTTYTLFGQNGVCSGSAVASISVNPKPIINLSINSATLCKGYGTGIYAIGAEGYTWTPGNITNSFVALAPSITTIYTVTGSSFNCFNTGTVALIVFENPTLSIANSSSLTCLDIGSTCTLSATGALTYTWRPISTNSPTVNITPISSMIYTVDGTNGFGCSSTNTLQVFINPNVTYSISQIQICSGKKVDLSAGGANNYYWLPINENESNIIITPQESTTYTLTGTIGPCSNTQTFSIEVIQDPIIEIPEVITPNDDGKNDFFKIETQYETKINLVVFNRWGNLVYKNEEYDNSWNGYAHAGFQVGHNKLPQGTYYYIIEMDNCDHKVVKGYVVIQY